MHAGAMPNPFESMPGCAGASAGAGKHEAASAGASAGAGKLASHLGVAPRPFSYEFSC